MSAWGRTTQSARYEADVLDYWRLRVLKGQLHRGLAPPDALLVEEDEVMPEPDNVLRLFD